MISLVTLMLGLVAVSAHPRNHQRVVGGTDATIDQYPEMVSLLYDSGTGIHRQACGGSILNNRAILTAAHCTDGDDVSKWQSRLGSTYANSGGIVLTSSKFINHPGWNIWMLDHDIGIIHVTGTIPFSDTIRVARIGAYHIGGDEVTWTAGWGRLSEDGPPSEVLQHVQLWTVDQAVCRQRFSVSLITDNMLCAGYDAGGRGSCTQDSGGPLLHHGVVVGVVSFSQGCARPQTPGVYARVSQYIDWITENA